MGSPTGREAHGDGILAVPKSDGCNGMTQTDCNVCRWLADHRPGDPVRGRVGEGEQAIRWPVAVRYARCGEPKQSWSSFVSAGELIDIERVRRVTHRVNCLLRRPEFKADDSEANDLPRPERAREQEPVCKAGSIRRRVGYGPATPARYGESCIA
jgi:hypothetical protein